MQHIVDRKEQTVALIVALQADEPGASEQLFAVLYDELHRIAGSFLRGNVPQTIGPTALIHEAFLRLVDHADEEWEGRRHFVRVAARAMRYVLLDRARAKSRVKRGGDRRRVTLDEGSLAQAEQATEIVAVGEALERLEEYDPELARIVELRFFAGLSNAEVAETTKTSLRTIERRWRVARALLLDELTEEQRDIAR